MNRARRSFACNFKPCNVVAQFNRQVEASFGFALPRREHITCFADWRALLVERANDPNGSASTNQSVLVAAGNAFHLLMVGGSIAIAGSVGVGATVTVGLVTLNTAAFIDNSATVKAANDVMVSATGRETIVSVAVSGGGGTVGVAGAVSVILLKTHTLAIAGGPPAFNTNDPDTGLGATITAGNNLLVSARDDTKVLVVAGGVAGGFVGVGAGVGVTSITKETRAFTHSGSTVDALANGKRYVDGELVHGFAKGIVADSLDGIKNLCFRYAAKSGLTISIDDVKTPSDKREILDGYEKRAEKVEDQFFKGIITDGERRQKEVEIWTAATEEVRARYDTSSLKAVVHAAAPCPAEVKRQMIEWWGPIIYEYYSATEGMGATFINSEEALRKPLTEAQVKALQPIRTPASHSIRAPSNNGAQ